MDCIPLLRMDSHGPTKLLVLPIGLLLVAIAHTICFKSSG